MKAILILAWQSALARRLTLAITLLAVAVSSALLFAVERVRQDARSSFSRSVAGVDLVVGARTGGMQLMLQAVFHAGGATHTFRRQSFETLLSFPEVDWAVPLLLGDSHRGFPVLGTSADYFRRFRYGDGQPLILAAGRPFAAVFEAVLGSQVAEDLGYRPGDRMTVTHGLSAHGPAHDDKPFAVVGVLAPTGTPVDRTVHLPQEAITAIHLDWAGGAPIPGVSIPADQVRKFDLRPREMSAALVGLKKRQDVFRVQRRINEFSGEPLIAVMPGVVLDEMWQAIGALEGALFAVSMLVVAVGLAGLCATLLAGLNERRRELAILRALGAGPVAVFLMLLAEGGVVTVLGALAGYALQALAVVACGPLFQAQFGVHLALTVPGGRECLLLSLIVGTGLFASLVPGWQAWRLSLTDGLNPRH